MSSPRAAAGPIPALLQHPALWAGLSLLAAMPVLLPVNQPPIVTAVNELAALGVGGLVLAALGLRALCLPHNRAGVPAGAAAPAHTTDTTAARLLIGAVTLAGLGSAVIALLQVLCPAVLQGPVGQLIEPTHLAGRAVGHLRQPNHLATTVLWGIMGWVVLVSQGYAGRLTATVGTALLVWALVLSGSRTGLLGIGLLLAWAMVDSSLSRLARGLLFSTPAWAAGAWWATHAWSRLTGVPFGASAHLAATGAGDISSSRFAIWKNTWELIQQQPWTGVGWGRFNFAWTLTPFPDRPTALFDHTHNLPLQLMVECGVPVGLALSAALLWVLVTAARRAWNADPQGTPWRRAAVLMLAVAGLHSLLEYPLWYAYFALPAAGACAVAWGSNPTSTTDEPGSAQRARLSALRGILLLATGTLMVIGALWAYADYQVIRAIYAPGKGAPPLAERMAKGQGNTWFADQAHYAVATNIKPIPRAPWTPQLSRAFEQAPWVLLDTRLMMAWADALASRDGPGDRDKARYLAARLKEFRPEAARDWLQGCASDVTAAPRFPCEAPEVELHWRDFLPAAQRGHGVNAGAGAGAEVAASPGAADQVRPVPASATQ